MSDVFETSAIELEVKARARELERRAALGPGVSLGPYEILSAIGAGGMGEVYRARDTRLGRDVAIKSLPALPPRRASRLAWPGLASAGLTNYIWHEASTHGFFAPSTYIICKLPAPRRALGPAEGVPAKPYKLHM